MLDSKRHVSSWQQGFTELAIWTIYIISDVSYTDVQIYLLIQVMTKMFALTFVLNTSKTLCLCILQLSIRQDLLQTTDMC